MFKQNVNDFADVMLSTSKCLMDAKNHTKIALGKGLVYVYNEDIPGCDNLHRHLSEEGSVG